MSNRYPYSVKQEKQILDLLEKGPMLHDDIFNEFKGRKEKGFSEKDINLFLKGMVAKDWVFRIERDGKVWYRINDFSLKIEGKITYLKLIEKYVPAFRVLIQKYIENLCEFHGKIPDKDILPLTLKTLENEEKMSIEQAMIQDPIQQILKKPELLKLLEEIREELKKVKLEKA